MKRRWNDSHDADRIGPDELNAVLETVHLLRSPKNAQRLCSALNRASQKKGKPESLASLKRELGLDSH